MTQHDLSQAIYQALAKTMYLVLGVCLLVWFIDAITVILLFFLVAVIFSLGLMPIVNWLEGRRIPRAVGTLMLFGVLLLVGVGLSALAWQPLKVEIQNLTNNAPRYQESLTARLNEVVGNYPEITDRLQDQKLLEQITPTATTLLSRVGRYSVNVLTVIIAMIVMVTTIAYVLILPRPLMRSLQMVIPVKLRDEFQVAFARGSQGVVNWIWANMAIGAIQGVAAAIFLSVMGIPGALVWGVITFFAELIPQLGSYLMAILPALIALSVDPMLAVWVILFYFVLQLLVNNLLAPVIRSNTMKIHPVSEIFTVLALALAFGILGAIIATPIIAFVKAFYDQFYSKKLGDDPDVDARTERMLTRVIPKDAT